MIFCKNCGYMLDDDAKFCTECGTPTENAQTNRQNAQNAQNGQTAGQNAYNPYDPYNPYNPYNPNYRPQPRPINVGMLIFTIINFIMVGALAVWPLVLLLRARNAPDDYSEAQQLEKVKSANVTCLIIGVIITVISYVFSTIAILLG